MADTVHIFAARMYKIGVIRFLDVPPEISKQLAADSPTIPVHGTADGVPLKTTLVPRGKGLHRMAIHSDIRKKLRMDAGAVLEIAIQFDEESREPVLPPALVVALRQNPRANSEFRSMTTALRRQIVRYLTAVKTQETLERRVTKFVRRLETRALAAKKTPRKKHKTEKKRRASKRKKG